MNEARIRSAYNLLAEMESKELLYPGRTLLGQIMKQVKCEETSAARAWMCGDYSLVRATVNAVVLLLEAGLDENN